MSEDGIPEDGAADGALGRALRRADGEARPRAEFREALREGFVGGRLPAPASGDGGPGRVPRRIAYSAAAAAALLLGLAGVSALVPREAPEEPPPPVVRPSPEEAALTAAERRLAADPVLGGRPWQRRIVEGRPWLFPAEAVAADAGEVALISRAMGEAQGLLAEMLPAAAGRASLPVVAVVAPTRSAFESLVSPLVDPLPLSEYTIAFGLPALRVLLVAPEALAPGGPPCEEMDIFHEAGHAWLHVRRRGAAPLPLWVEEGLAGAVSTPGGDAREWSRKLLGAVRGAGLDPFTAEEVLGLETIGDAARRVAAMAPCDERPFSLMATFHAHAESLVAFLLDGSAGDGRPGRFAAWLEGALDGRATSPRETAEALGFESPGALLAARDAWMEP